MVTGDIDSLLENVGQELWEFRHMAKSFDDIKRATNDFSSILGTGGFGIVYRGTDIDGKPWAVKKMHHRLINAVVIKEFIQEIQIMVTVRHINVVNLLGYCYQGGDRPELILVYEFLPNGTLAKALRLREAGQEASTRYSAHGIEGSEPFSFQQRIDVAVGTATGLLHMHKGLGTPIMHRDIKPQNILLDNNFKAKLADFGRVKSVQRSSLVGGQDVTLSGNFGGTFGYIDPKFVETGKFNRKSDVFSLGVVLLQLLTGKEAVIEGPGSGAAGVDRQSLYKWANQHLQNLDGESLRSILDPTLEHEDIPERQLEKFARVALKCVKEKRNERPTIKGVLSELEDLRPENAAGTDSDDDDPDLDTIDDDESLDDQTSSSSTSTSLDPRARGRSQSVVEYWTGESASSTNSTSNARAHRGATMPREGRRTGSRGSMDNVEDLFRRGMDLAYKREAQRNEPRDFVGAANLFAQAADRGHAGATYELAEMHHYGLGVTKDEDKWKELHLKAEKLGFSPSLAECHFWGWERAVDMKAAYQLCLEAAQQGHAGAQADLGYLLKTGRGVTRDLTAAREWFLAAAEQDHVMAQIDIGLCFYRGSGVPRDDGRAEQWFQQATRDNPFAYTALGLCFYEGKSVAQDVPKAIQYWRRVVAENSSATCPGNRSQAATAHYWLGRCHQDGMSVREDKQAALHHFQQSADLGSLDAKRTLNALQSKKWFSFGSRKSKR